MPTLLLIFYLVTKPADKLVCTLWTDTVPTSADVAAACGEIDLAALRLDMVQTDNGALFCQTDAEHIYALTAVCPPRAPLDYYRIELRRPGYVELVCAIQTESSPPTREEIIAACGPAAYQSWASGALELKFIGTKEKEPAPDPDSAPACQPPALKPGPGLLQQPENAAGLASAEKYYLLAGKLIWYGYAAPDCDTWSGIDPATGAATPCGLNSAAPQLYAWQNRLDESIFSAAMQYNVPPRLLKELIARETQFWPWTGTDGEAGLIQLTGQGADTVLHYFLEGYHRLTPAERQAARTAWLDELRCDYCTIEQAMQHAERVMPRYAQALAAYYCRYGSWEAALRAWNVRHADIVGG